METGDSYVPPSCHGMTPTLQNIDVLLGLSIDGQACTAVDIQNKITLCKSVFRRIPLPKMFKRNALSMKWLWENFFELPNIFVLCFFFIFELVTNYCIFFYIKLWSWKGAFTLGVATN
jgi:hypothetical protein